jgi:hypothetical protein
MDKPSDPAIKALFAASGNRCAFPGCSIPMVDFSSPTRTVLGQVCHIKASRPLGPRYDPGQTPEQRHGFENLILMCGSHNKTIDSDATTYTVAALVQIKANHETKFRTERVEELSDDLVDKLKLAVVNVQGDAFVINSHQQSGGVTAGVMNVGRQPLRLNPQAVARLMELASGWPGTSFKVAVGTQAEDTVYLADMIRQVLLRAGWTTSYGIAFVMPAQPGIVVQCAERIGAADAVCRWLQELYIIRAAVRLAPKNPEVFIVVGAIF